MMAGWSCGVLMCLALSGVGVGIAGARPGRPTCVVYRCRTLAASAQIRVYQARNRHPAVEIPFLSSFARWLPTGRLTPLGDNVETTRILKLKLLALAGRFVADATESCGKEGCASSVARLNVQTGRRERATPSTASWELGNLNGKCVGGPPGALGVTDIIVTPSGTVAWIMGGSIEVPTNRVDLNSRTVCELPPKSSTPVVVASSTRIEPKTLAGIPGRLYWLEGGAPRTAVIP
jgi:hypothetical protein